MLPVNPFDRRVRPDPYPIYQYMRTVEPVHRAPTGFFILTRYADCKSVLEDKRWSHDADKILEPGRANADPVDPTVRLLRASVAFADMPRHAKQYRPLDVALRRAASRVGPRAQKVAKDLITLMLQKETGPDLVRDFARPLALVVLADMLGLPPADRTEIQRWSHELASGLDPAVKSANIVKAGAAAAAMVEYMLERLGDAGDAVAGGVIAELANAKVKLRTWDLIADLAVILIIGLETTTGLVGNGMLALLRNPEQMKRLRAAPGLMDGAVEELVRFDGPIHLTARVAKDKLEIGGKSIAAGEQVVVLIAAANRDPTRFTGPDQLDITRSDNGHLGFGAGLHSCFAAPLARLITGTAIKALLDGLEDLELAGDPQWNDNVTLRGLSRLPIKFRR